MKIKKVVLTCTAVAGTLFVLRSKAKKITRQAEIEVTREYFKKFGHKIHRSKWEDVLYRFGKEERSTWQKFLFWKNAAAELLKRN